MQTRLSSWISPSSEVEPGSGVALGSWFSTRGSAVRALLEGQVSARTCWLLHSPTLAADRLWVQGRTEREREGCVFVSRRVGE